MTCGQRPSQPHSPGQAAEVNLTADVGAWTQNHPQPNLSSHQDKGPGKVKVSHSQDTPVEGGDQPSTHTGDRTAQVLCSPAFFSQPETG